MKLECGPFRCDLSGNLLKTTVHIFVLTNYLELMWDTFLTGVGVKSPPTPDPPGCVTPFYLALPYSTLR